MSPWILFGVLVLVQVTAITMAAISMIRLARRSADWRHAIGLTGLLFLFASPVISWQAPKATWPFRAYVTTIYGDADLYHSSRQATLELSQSQFVAAQQNMSRAGQTTPVGAGLTSSHNPSESWFDATAATWLARGAATIGAVWVLGILVLCLREVVARRQLRRLAASLRFVEALDPTVAHQVRTALGLQRLPRIAVSEAVAVPLVLGVWRPVVVLPPALLELSQRRPDVQNTLQDVLIHECAHVRRHDPWTHFTQRLASTLFWPHPGVHRLNREIDCAREEICDNFVLTHRAATSYAQTLLDLAETSCGSRFRQPVLALLSRHWSLEQRIAGILDPRRSTATRSNRRAIVFASALLAGITLLIGGVHVRGQGTSEAIATKRITVHGICQDQDKNPIPNARVRIVRGTPAVTQSSTVIAEVQTDDQGRYSIPNVEIESPLDSSKQQVWIAVVATAPGHASIAGVVREEYDHGEIPLTLSNNPGALSGVVTDENKNPLRGAVVCRPLLGRLPEFYAVTDEQGRYTISDMASWKQDGLQPVPGKPMQRTFTTCYFWVLHPDYAPTAAVYSKIPQQVDVTLEPPAIVEGQVVDQVTGQPMPNVVVEARSIVGNNPAQARTDQDGHYRFRTNHDYFNIWADADDRVAIAVKALPVKQGETVHRANISMVRGGFITGTVIDAKTDKPLAPKAIGYIGSALTGRLGRARGAP